MVMYSPSTLPTLRHSDDVATIEVGDCVPRASSIPSPSPSTYRPTQSTEEGAGAVAVAAAAGVGAAGAAAAAGAAVTPSLPTKVHVMSFDQRIAPSPRRPVSLSILSTWGLTEASTDPRIAQSALRAEIIPGSLVTTWRMKIVSPSGSR